MEHRILKTLLHVWFERSGRGARRQYVKGRMSGAEARVYESAFVHFDATVKRFNDSLGLCIT